MNEAENAEIIKEVHWKIFRGIIMIKIAICDDEEHFRQREEQIIMQYINEKDCNCEIDLYKSGKELLNIKHDISNYNIVFLDINMGELDGIETAKQIRNYTKDTYIVFVTAVISYSLEGYKVDAVRYLLKDNECLDTTISECLDAILYKMNYVQCKKIFEFQEGKREVYLEDIVYVNSNLHKLTFHLINEKKYTLYDKLDTIQTVINNSSFCRIHKSYLVNLKYVKNMQRYKALLSDGLSLEISKQRYMDARNELICYRGEI